MIPGTLKQLWRLMPRGSVIVFMFVLMFTAGMFIMGQYHGVKYAGTLTMVIVYFIHLGIGAGSGFTILRLWYHRSNPLIKRMAIYMHAAPIGALTAIVLLFMSRGITLTWKFTITLFVGTLIADLVRLPFVVYMLKGDNPHASTVPEQIIKPPASPDMNTPS